MAGRAFVGTSGFAYKEWKGEFYPADLAADRMLGFYATRFSSVEINYTFQRLPSEKTLARWVADTPDGFVFSPKMHRQITHMRRLRGEVAEPVAQFLHALTPLGDRLGAILVQCPPTLKADLGLFRAFLDLLPADRRFAFEFRHESCNTDEVKQILSDRGAAWCVADEDERDAPFERTASGFVYLRLRKSVYDDEALARWAKEIGQALTDGVDVFCYLKHEEQARGVHFAGALQAMIWRDQLLHLPE